MVFPLITRTAKRELRICKTHLSWYTQNIFFILRPADLQRTIMRTGLTKARD